MASTLCVKSIANDNRIATVHKALIVAVVWYSVLSFIPAVGSCQRVDSGPTTPDFQCPIGRLTTNVQCPIAMSPTCIPCYCKRCGVAVGACAVVIHVCYHILHIWMRQCGACSRYCQMQVIVWCWHLTYTVLSGLIGIFASTLTRHDLQTVALYWGQFASNILSCVTASLILYYKDCKCNPCKCMECNACVLRENVCNCNHPMCILHWPVLNATRVRA